MASRPAAAAGGCGETSGPKGRRRQDSTVRTVPCPAPAAVGGATTLSAPGQAITLTNAANNFTGTVKATGAVTQITDVNALTAELTTTGSTTLSAGGTGATLGAVDAVMMHRPL